jgi:molybdopterin converting factor subunit 1
VTVTVLYFGIVRERLGIGEEAVEIDAGATVETLMSRLTDLHPDLADGVESVRVAVNRDYVDSSRVLSDNDEIAVIPPVSGG